MTGRVIKAFGRYYTIRDGGRDITSVLRATGSSGYERLRSFSEPVAWATSWITILEMTAAA
jgi:hypothetical protein